MAKLPLPPPPPQVPASPTPPQKIQIRLTLLKENALTILQTTVIRVPNKQPGENGTFLCIICILFII